MYVFFLHIVLNVLLSCYVECPCIVVDFLGCVRLCVVLGHVVVSCV